MTDTNADIRSRYARYLDPQHFTTNRLKALLMCLIAFVVIALVLILCAHDYLNTRLYISNGYQQNMVEGSNYAKWQKYRRR